MSLVNEHERRALASVGNTHAASLLAQLTQTPVADHQNGSTEALVGQRIQRNAEDTTVLSFSLSDIANEQSPLHLRTKQISKPGDKGPSSTVRPLAIVKDFLSYVLRKGEAGMVRVIHCPTVCKALVSHQAAVVADQCMKIATARTDTVPSVLTASIDRSGVCCVSLYSTPGQDAQPSDALRPTGTCRIDICSNNEREAGSESALVDITDNKAVAVYGKKLFEIDLATCLKPYADMAGLPEGSNESSGVRELYAGLPPATFVALNAQASEVAVGCVDGTVHVLGTHDVYPVTSFNTCEPAFQGPVLHVAFLPSHPHSVLASATEQANGTLTIGVWKVDRTAANPVHKLVPVDTLELSGVGAMAAPPGAPRRWCVGVHAAMGVVLAAQAGGRDIVCFAVNGQHRFCYRSRLTVGSPIISFAVDESSCALPAAAPNSARCDAGEGQILVRCPEGIELAAIECEQLRPMHDPPPQAAADQAAPLTVGAVDTTSAAAVSAPPAAAGDVLVAAADAGAHEEGEQEGGQLSKSSSLTSMLLEAARASAGGGGMGLPSLASLSTPPDASRQQSTAAVPGVVRAPLSAAPTSREPELDSAAAPVQAEDAAGLAAAVAAAAIENVIDCSAGGGRAGDGAGPAPVVDVRAADSEALLSSLLGGRPPGGSAADIVSADPGVGAPAPGPNGAAQRPAHGSAAGVPAGEEPAGAGPTQENALVERLLNKNARVASAVASGAGTPHAGGAHAEDAAAKAAAAPATDAGREGLVDGAAAALRTVEGLVRDCYNMSKGVQSTVSRLQHDVGKLHSEVAKGAKAQAAMEKAVRRAEAGVEKVPDAVGAAVASGLEAHLKQAVAEQLGEAVAHGFRSAFSAVLVPAFEGAMQTMFAQANDALNKGLAQHMSAAEASLAATATRLEGDFQAAIASIETAATATLAAATAAAAPAAPAQTAPPPAAAPAAPGAPKPTPAYSGNGGGGVPEYIAVGGQVLYGKGGGGGAPATAPAPARQTPRGYTEQPSTQQMAGPVQTQPATAAGYGSPQASGAEAASVRVPPPWQYLSTTVATAPTPSAPDAPPGFAAIKDTDPPSQAFVEYAPELHTQALPPGHAAPTQQTQPHRNGAMWEAAGAEPSFHAGAAAHPQHVAHGYHAPRAPPQPTPPVSARTRRDRPEGVPVYEHISRIVAALEHQDAVALADVCLQTPVALVQEMSQLHAAVIMNMLCPLVSRGHPGIVGLFGWLQRCAERVSPQTIEQPKQVRLVFQKVLDAVDLLLAVEEAPQTINAGIGVRKVLNERLPQFPV